MRTFEIHTIDKNGNPDMRVWDFADDKDVTATLVQEFAESDFWRVLSVIERAS